MFVVFLNVLLVIPWKKVLYDLYIYIYIYKKIVLLRTWIAFI